MMVWMEFLVRMEPKVPKVTKEKRDNQVSEDQM